MKKLALVAIVLGSAFIASAGCSSNPVVAAGDGGATGACLADLQKKDFCSSCTAPANANPTSCRAPRTVNACCTFVAPPTKELTRGTGLVRYSTTDPTLNLGCLDNPGTLEASKTVTLKGFVRLFSSGNDSAGVKLEIFKEGPNGTVGERVGTATETKNTDEVQTPKPTWLKKCPEGGCSFRAYTYVGVPTETPLIVKTSDVTPNGSQWKELYDYNVMFRNRDINGDTIAYDPAAVAATDVNTVAAAAGGFIPKPDKGVLAGEIHDCGDIRVAGATVDTDVPHEADVFYFGENEADPLPDQQQARSGTSKLGLFGALNFATGVPVRVTAVGKVGGQTLVLGTHVVQMFPGAVTALSLRGRRPSK